MNLIGRFQKKREKNIKKIKKKPTFFGFEHFIRAEMQGKLPTDDNCSPNTNTVCLLALYKPEFL